MPPVGKTRGQQPLPSGSAGYDVIAVFTVVQSLDGLAWCGSTQKKTSIMIPTPVLSWIQQDHVWTTPVYWNVL